MFEGWGAARGARAECDHQALLLLQFDGKLALRFVGGWEIAQPHDVASVRGGGRGERSHCHDAAGAAGGFCNPSSIAAGYVKGTAGEQSGLHQFRGGFETIHATAMLRD